MPVWIPSGPISLITAVSSGLRVFSIAFVVACGMWVHVVHEPNVNHLPSNVTNELKKVHFTRLLIPISSNDVCARCKIMFALFQKQINHTNKGYFDFIGTNGP